MEITPEFIKRHYQQQGLWSGAAEAWRFIGYEADALACEMIAESKRKSDQFRIKVAEHCGAEPDLKNGIDWNTWKRNFDEIETNFV
jgi:hypothetical protein